MTRNSSTGASSFPASSFNPATAGQFAQEDDWNALREDLQTQLSHAAATTQALYPTSKQVQESALSGGLATFGGTADALTITLAITPAAYVKGLVVEGVIGGSANATATPTLNVNSLGAKTITQSDGTPLSAGELVAGNAERFVYDGTNFRRGATANTLSSEAEAKAGTDNTTVMTPLRTANALGALGMELISTTTIGSPVATSPAILLPTGYGKFLIDIEELIPANDLDILWMRTSTDGGSNFDSGSSNYDWQMLEVISTSATPTNSAGDTKIVLIGAQGVGNDTNENGVSGEIYVYKPHAATRTRFQSDLVAPTSAGNVVMHKGSSQRLAAADVDALRFLFSTGNITSGVIRVYGMLKS